MPQRDKTPPPPQDEIFMTVHYPYPQHANMDIDEDVERVARWLGSIVKPKYFNAFYYKPSARNTVIIEVSKAIGDDKRKLLGQHTWKDILLNPSDGEKGHRSGIFYCIYNNLREVQKEGWRRIDFEDTWFMPRDGRKYTSIHYDQAEWDRIVEEDRVFCIPYPLSIRCEVPAEDPTNRGFCRPLPVSLFPIPVLPEMPKEVPGTLKWTKVKAIPESEWAKMSPKAIKEMSGSQKTKGQRGRAAAPRNSQVGPPVVPVNSGVNVKSPGSLPPNLVTNDKGKGKQKESGEPSISVDELVAHTIAMNLEDEEDKDYQEYYGAGMESALDSIGTVTSPTFPSLDHDLIDHTGVGVHVSGVTVKPVVVEDSLWGDPLENINKKQKKDDGVPLCEFHGKVCSKGICKVYEKQLREYNKKQKDLQPRDRRKENDGQNNGGGGTRDRGALRGSRMLLRGGPPPGRDSGPRPSTDENWAPRKPNGVPPPRNTPLRNTQPRPNNDSKDNNSWGVGNNAWSRSEMGGSTKPAGKPDSNSSPKDEKEEKDCLWNPSAAQGWSQSELGGSSQAGPWSGPGKGDNGGKDSPWDHSGAQEWSQSEIGGGSQAGPWPGPGKDDTREKDSPWNNPAAQDWSQSEIGGGSQAGPWSGSGKDENRKKGSPSNNPPAQDRSQGEIGGDSGADRWSRPRKDDGGGKDGAWNPPAAQDWSRSEVGSVSQADPWSRRGNAGGKPNDTNNEPGGTRKSTLAKAGWGSSGGAKDWTPSELGVDDSVSQRGDDDIGNAPKRHPEKKSWADEVEEEMGYANGKKPAPMVAPEPDLWGDDGGDEGWPPERVKRKRNPKGGRGKARSATGWSGITNQGHW